MSFVPVNPRPMLQNLVDQDIVVRLKWGETEYKGKLVSLDSYLNLQLSSTVEYINDKPTGDLGQVLIRCVLSSFFCLARFSINRLPLWMDLGTKRC